MRKFLLALISAAMCAMLLSGCAGSSFASVDPPVPEFDEEYYVNEVEAFTGTLTVEKTFSGNKAVLSASSFPDYTLTEAESRYLGSSGSFEALYLSSSGTTKSFEVGEKGVVTYDMGNESYSVEAVITRCPANGEGGVLVAAHAETANVPSGTPGKFRVVVETIQDCVMLKKSCVAVLDDEGNALCYQLDEDGFLIERRIKTGANNTEYYQVLEGLDAGETVVER